MRDLGTLGGYGSCGGAINERGDVAGAAAIADGSAHAFFWKGGSKLRDLGTLERAGIAMPEVAVFEGEPNAFATGAFKNSALVAVSTGLLQSMNRDEVEAVIGHEVAHIANGDMVTMTLIQGVMNTFVVFLSRVIGSFVDRVVFRNERGPGAGYYITTIVLDLVLGLVAAMIVAWFSRHREYRADAGSAQLLGRRQPMINALARLGGLEPGQLPQAVQAMGINGPRSGLMALFASHPPIEDRIRALQQQAAG
jgi:heat shock protein HtpX